MTTPEYLKGLVAYPEQRMIYCKNLIIVHDLETATVEHGLRYMDQQGELQEFSLLIEPAEGGDYVEEKP